MGMAGSDRLDDRTRRLLEAEEGRHRAACAALAASDGVGAAAELTRHLARVDEILLGHARQSDRMKRRR